MFAISIVNLKESAGGHLAKKLAGNVNLDHTNEQQKMTGNPSNEIKTVLEQQVAALPQRTSSGRNSSEVCRSKNRQISLYNYIKKTKLTFGNERLHNTST